ncbi:MAG: peptidylprolyl isomerase, partial [Nanoarchaeota archaeon]
MTNTIKHHDFIEVDYTGMLLDGTIFDTTQQSVAEKHHQGHAHNREYKPTTVCVGEQQLLPGFDRQLEGKEIGNEYTITLKPEEAFGKRDIKKVKIVPTSTFKEHNLQPHPGLQINVDGERGIITSISGGRVIVNFNHPLAGKEVQYQFIVRQKITDPKEQIITFLQTALRLPRENINVSIAEKKAHVA